MLVLLKRWMVCIALLAMAANAAGAPKTVLVMGDSLSAEYGIARGTGWVALFEARLKEQKVAAHIVNASISGETTSGGKTRLSALLDLHHPDVVVIELGANDGLRGLPLAAARANLRTMIELSQKHKARVLLVGLRLPPNYGRDFADRFFAMYGSLAQQYKTALVPFMFDGFADKPALFQADRIHPLADAHPTILNNIWPHLWPLVKP